jgi:hypothetical protein
MLHIADGDCVAGTLRETGLPGEVRVFGDLMYEGPCPAGLSAEEWLETRARFLADGDVATLDDARACFRAFDETLAATPAHDETVLWLDHHLADQLILIKLLDWFGARPRRDRVRLVSVDRLLGWMDPAALSGLFGGRQPISGAQYRLASSAWQAFTSPDPVAIERLLDDDTSALPFLSAALRRHLEQFPWVDGGLSRTDRQALAVLRASGPLPFTQLFAAVQRLENPLFMGDLSLLGMLTELAGARVPLVRGEHADDLAIGTLAITDAGLAVLDERADHVRLNGIDRWLGGVHLAGDDAGWRWDSTAGRLR